MVDADRLGASLPTRAASAFSKLGELDDVALRHGVSLLYWRSGGVEHHHDTPPYLVKPSPTSGHSSVAELVDLSCLSDETFDLAYTGGHVAVWVSDLQRYYREAARVLKSDGLLIVSEY